MNGKHLAWSVRRELWEHRSVYIVPLVVSVFVLLSFLVNIGFLPAEMRNLPNLPDKVQLSLVIKAYSLGASVILVSGFILAAIYCLDALRTERRDRSILFWKSMPVSDATTVVSKALIPLLVVPVTVFTVTLCVQIVMAVISAGVLTVRDVELAGWWSRLPLPTMTLVMLYGIVVHTLWFAPIYAVFLLVSAWAQRSPFLWVLLPAFAGTMLEKITFGTGYLASFINYRVTGAMGLAFTEGAGHGAITRLSQLDPIRFLTSAGLWLGLVAAAVFIVAAIRLRRSREPG